MRGIEILVWLVIALLLRATPAVADVARDLARCELEAERLYPAPDNKGLANWPEREANLEKRADNTETCMRAAGYSVMAHCSTLHVAYKECYQSNSWWHRWLGR